MTDDAIIRLLELRREDAVSAFNAKYGGYCRQLALRIRTKAQPQVDFRKSLHLPVIRLRAWGRSFPAGGRAAGFALAR